MDSHHKGPVTRKMFDHGIMVYDENVPTDEETWWTEF